MNQTANSDVQTIDTVLLKVASRCNIACDYCYMYYMGDTGWSRMPKAMSTETIDAVIASLAVLLSDQGRPFSIVLHGGEPLLLGVERLRRLLLGLRKQLADECSISIQTNAILLTSDILELCANSRTTLSVSLDGPEKANDLHRLGFTHESTFERTMNGIRLLQEHSQAATLFTGILCVIDPTTDPSELYAFFKSIEVPSLNFLFRDGNHSRLPHGKASFDSREYGRWFTRLWDVYYADPDPVPIRTLDDTARLILGGRASKEGMGTSDYAIIIIDTDGSVSKNDTLKSTFDGADRFDANWSISSDRIFDIAQSDHFHRYIAMQQPSSATCRCCPYLSACGGGMPLYRWSNERRFDNPSVYCNDHKLIIDHIRETLLTDIRCASQ